MRLEHLLQDSQIVARSKLGVLPEGSALRVARIQEDVALLNSLSGEALETPSEEHAPDAPIAMSAIHGQVMQVAAAAVVPTQYCADQRPRFVQRDRAQARVSLEKCSNTLFAIALVQTDAFGPFPKLECRGVVIESHRAKGCSHAGLTETASFARRGRAASRAAVARNLRERLPTDQVASAEL
jgi:hypothetical protein